MSRRMVSRRLSPLTSAIFVDFRRRKAMQVNLKALLDATEQVLVPFDLQIRVQPALHQHARSAQIDGLPDFLEDGLLGQHVALGVAHGTVKRLFSTPWAAPSSVLTTCSRLLRNTRSLPPCPRNQRGGSKSPSGTRPRRQV